MTHARQTIVTTIFVTALASGAFVGRGFAQTQQQSGVDVLPELLQEVRGLRAALEQMATANAHAQVLVGRLQLQESRMTSMIRRLDTVRDELAKAQNSYNETRSALKRLEGARSRNEAPQEDRDLEEMLRVRKLQVDAARASVDRFTTEEAQLTSDLTAEQARWVEINQRLDELERALTKR